MFNHYIGIYRCFERLSLYKIHDRVKRLSLHSPAQSPTDRSTRACIGTVHQPAGLPLDLQGPAHGDTRQNNAPLLN